VASETRSQPGTHRLLFPPLPCKIHLFLSMDSLFEHVNFVQRCQRDPRRCLARGSFRIESRLLASRHNFFPLRRTERDGEPEYLAVARREDHPESANIEHIVQLALQYRIRRQQAMQGDAEEAKLNATLAQKQSSLSGSTTARTMLFAPCQSVTTLLRIRCQLDRVLTSETHQVRGSL